ncbi:MAG TPA: NADH:flavin oxidoreductase, partial [Dongiaceae bacterium]
DYRVGQIGRLPNVEVFLESRLAAADIAGMDCRHVILATGASWRRDGTGYAHPKPVIDPAAPRVFTPDDVLAGRLPEGRVVIYDDDQYYMAGAIAEKLVQAGRHVTFVTPGLEVSSWTVMTDEQFRVQTRLMAAGVAIHLARRLASWDGATARIASIYDGDAVDIAGDSLLLVAARDPVDALARELAVMREGGELDRIETLHTIGDAFVPGAIYAAVYAGHRAAREFGETIDPDEVGYIRELVSLGNKGEERR